MYIDMNRIFKVEIDFLFCRMQFGIVGNKYTNLKYSNKLLIEFCVKMICTRTASLRKNTCIKVSHYGWKSSGIWDSVQVSISGKIKVFDLFSSQ